MSKHKSEDQGVRDFTPVDGKILTDGYPTEQLSAEADIARGWATYTSLNPMDADVLNRGAVKPTHSNVKHETVEPK
jgi:hypothetical protein